MKGGREYWRQMICELWAKRDHPRLREWIRCAVHNARTADRGLPAYGRWAKTPGPHLGGQPRP